MTQRLVFKCANGLAPDYLGKQFIKRLAVHNMNTSGCNNFVDPRYRLSKGILFSESKGMEWAN